jgi:hypothetical protein
MKIDVMSKALVAAACFLVVACGAEQTPDTGQSSERRSAESVAGSTAEPTIEQDDEVLTVDEPPDESQNSNFDDAPEGTQTLATLLRARHVEDLPTPEDLQTYPDAGASLLWIEANATHMFERTRSLSLMRHTPSEAVLERLTLVAGSEEEHSVARAAATESLAFIAAE